MSGERPGAHVYWTRPRWLLERRFSGFEAVTLAVSCLMWRRFNGPVYLFTDHQGRDQFARMGLLGFWDEVDCKQLGRIPERVNPGAFWDIGKTIVLGALEVGGCVLDLDLIIWGTLPAHCEETARFLHWEYPVPPWYPGPDALSSPPGYNFDPAFDWAAPVANTAFMQAGSRRFRDEYVASALEYAIGNRPEGSGVPELLFSAQRMFSHVARKLGVGLIPLVDYLVYPDGPSRWLTTNGNTDPLALEACEHGIIFTHLWRNKWPLLQDPPAAEQFRRLLIERCLRLAPELAPGRAKLESLRGDLP